MVNQRFLVLLIFFSVLCLASQLTADPALDMGQVSKPLMTDRKRIRVAEVPDPYDSTRHLKVLRSDFGTPLRAGTVWLWSQDPKEQPSSYFSEMREACLNAVRIILFDVWMQEEGHATHEWSDTGYRNAMIARIERAVNYCSANGLYAIINAHNRVPSMHPKYDEKLNTALWTSIAPYFADRTHVAYELSNETIAGAGKDGELESEAKQTLEALVRVHAVARKLAPQTHLMILTPAGISGWGTSSAMSNLTRKFEALAGRIDWSKTSVAYHLYHADTNLFPTAENLRAFHTDFPGWPSENNFPPGFSGIKLGLQEGDNERSVSFGDDVFIMQTCERLGLGWSQWHINGPEQLRRNWPVRWADAVAKGYAWKSDAKVGHVLLQK